MQTRESRFSVAVVCVFLLLLQATGASAAQTRAEREARDVARLQREVNHQLLLLPWYSVFDNLQYRINGTQVVLSGQVLHDTLKGDAERAVKDIEGVTKVINNIELLPPSPADDAIRRATYRAIYGQSGLEVYGVGNLQAIHIIVKNGHITLEGTVLNQGHKNLAGIQANGVPGTFSVTNNLRVEPSQRNKK